MSNDRHRGWCFTVNNYSEEDEHLVIELQFKARYVVVGKEVGASGTPHLQGFVYFEYLVSFRQVLQFLPWGAHVEAMAGTVEQAAQYCKKDGDFFEAGSAPLSKKSQGEMEKARWELAVAAYQAGDFEAVPKDIGVRYGSGLAAWATKLKLAATPVEDTEARMLWYYGPSGSGKSRKARSENPGAYLKMCNKWWDGYSGQDVVLIEDFDKDHKCLCHHMKIWGDRYPFPAEIKGGKLEIRPRLVIVTSNYHPAQIWTEAEDYQPIMRRFNVIEFGAEPIRFEN